MRVHGAWVAAAEEVRLKHGPALTRTMLTMFGTMLLNGAVFISIFNGVNNLMAAKVSWACLWFLSGLVQAGDGPGAGKLGEQPHGRRGQPGSLWFLSG